MIRNLKETGMSSREIAGDLGISRNTVSRMLKKQGYRKKRKGTGDQSLIHTGKKSVYS